jgi:heme-degrading monooxygenase HmoA
MFSVIFEVHPAKDRFNEYLELAGRLKPVLERIDGFVDNERFESRSRAGWLLSHSTWRDEKSVIRWRTQAQHHQAQARGRAEIFQDYRLRVGEITSDTAPPAGLSLKAQRLDETETGEAKLATLTEVTAQPDAVFASRAELLPRLLGLDSSAPAIVECEIFESIYQPGKLAMLVGWRTASEGTAWRPALAQDIERLRHRTVRVVRQYGLADRREAPQFYPPVGGDDGER